MPEASYNYKKTPKTTDDPGGVELTARESVKIRLDDNERFRFVNDRFE